jgi:hypothetical protein
VTGPAAQRLARAGASAALLIALMVLASVGLWIGVPLAWLWIGSRVQGMTQSVGAAIGVMFAGAIVSIALFVPLLGWLNHKHAELRQARIDAAARHGRLGMLRASRGMPPQRSIVLEAVLVVTATIAVVVFCLWFFVFAGANPFPFMNSG